MSNFKRRPNNIGILLLGGLIGLPVGLFLSNFFPEGSGMKVFAGIGGIAAPPVALLVY